MKSLKDLKTYKLILVDTMNLAYRSFNGLPFHNNNKPTGMQYGILRFYIDMKKKYPNAEIRFLWEGWNSWRKKKYPIYKSSRRLRIPDPDFTECLKQVRDMLKYLDCKQCTLEGYEADDLAKFYAYDNPDIDKLLVTKDHDWFVMVDDYTDILSGKIILKEEDLEKSLGHTVSKLTLYMLLTGDKSDDIPGIPRFRTKIALEMCNDLSIESEMDIIPWLRDHGYDSWADKVKVNWWIIDRNIDLIYFDSECIDSDAVKIDTGCLDVMYMQKFIAELDFKSFEYYFKGEL